MGSETLRFVLRTAVMVGRSDVKIRKGRVTILFFAGRAIAFTRLPILKIIENVALHCENYDKDYIYLVFLPRFSALFNSSRDFARESAVLTLPKLAKCFGPSFTEKCLVPHLVNLASDSDSGIRDACAAVFAEIAPYCSESVRRNQLTMAFVEFINKESFNNPECINELGRFIATFADFKKTGLLMRDGEIVNANYRRRNRRGRRRLSSRRLFMSMLQQSQCEEAPPPDPENKLPAQTLQIQSPTLIRSSSDNESSLRKFCKYSSSSSPSSTQSSSEGDNDLFSAEEPLDTTLQENERYTDVPSGFEMPAKPKLTSHSLFYNQTREFEWGELDVNDMHEFDSGSDDEDFMNASFVHDEADPETDFLEQASSKNRCSPTKPSEEVCSFYNYWTYNVDIDDTDIEHYSELSHISPPLQHETLNFELSMLEETLNENPHPRDCEVSLVPPKIDLSSLDESSTVKMTIQQTLVKSLLPDNMNAKREMDVDEYSIDVKAKTEFETGVSEKNFLYTNISNDMTMSEGFSFNERNTLDAVKRPSMEISPSKSGDRFWSMSLIQKTTESVKKTTAAARQTADEITHASSVFLSKIRLPQATRFLSPSPRKFYQNQSASVREPQAPETPAIDRRSEKSQATSLKSRKRRMRKDRQKSKRLCRQAADASTESFVGSDGVKCFLTEEEREIFMSVAQDVIPQELLDTVIQLQLTDYKQNDLQRHSILAESMPAIVYTFGPKYWLYVKAIYMSFCVHESSVVRTKMAQSIHLIAQIIGPKHAAKDLCKVFRRFSRDNADIQQALLKNLYAFMKALPSSSRQSLAAELNAFNTYDVNNLWRSRHNFIEQLIKLVGLYRPYEINTFLVPFALAFSADKIAEIRLTAINMVASILAVFIKHEHSACKRSGLSISSPNSMPLSEKFLEEIQNGFWKTKNWRRRQGFALMMSVMLEKELVSRKKFCHVFKTSVIELSAESISNIRQYFCKIIELIGRERLEVIDSEFHSLALSRLHQMAAVDPDLEIRMMSRVVLGTVDRVKNEVDLTCRVDQTAA